ncbi:MAG: hypothetical protein GY725_22625 [bacterium]|nr:hypothetical protein [bacterium]
MSDSAGQAELSGNDGRTSQELDGAELFPILEEHIEQLLARYRESRKTIGELEGVIRDRDRQLALLDQQIGESEKQRTQVAARLDRLIAQLDELERATDATEQVAADSKRD